MTVIFAILLSFGAIAYIIYPSDFVLLAIPLLAVAGWKACGRQINHYNAFFFAFYLILSSLALQGNLLVSFQFGAIAYSYLFSAALVAVAQQLVERNDS